MLEAFNCPCRGFPCHLHFSVNAKSGTACSRKSTGEQNVVNFPPASRADADHFVDVNKMVLILSPFRAFYPHPNAMSE
jgi:hypothetical protein